MNLATATPTEIDTRIAELNDEEDRLLARLDRIRAARKPLTDEYDNRGGWARAYFVNNPDGHVHHGNGCATLRWNTDLRWLTEYSGRNQEEVIAAAGWRACTVCYPDAPLGTRETLPSLISSDEDNEREARAAERAAKAAEKATKEVRDENGQTVYKTERAAEIEAVGALTYAYGALTRTDVFDDIREASAREHVKDAKQIITLLTAKRGEDPTAALVGKAAAKVIREAVEWNKGQLSDQYGKAYVPAKAEVVEALTPYL